MAVLSTVSDRSFQQPVRAATADCAGCHETGLGRLLDAYASPGLSKKTRARIEVFELEAARSRGRLDAITESVKASTAFERRAEEGGLTKPDPETWVSVAAARREQRARKKAGLPPRPRGRPRQKP